MMESYRDNFKAKEEEAETGDQYNLANLPTEILQKEIGQHLSFVEKRALYMIGNRNLFYAFREGNAEIAMQLKKLLLHVVRGEKEEAKELITKEPRLLLLKGNVIDYSGRKIHGTAWQIAAGAEDFSRIHLASDGSYYSFPDEMVEMIEGYLKQLPNGDSEILKQQAEQFPNGWEQDEKIRKKEDLIALDTVFNAIKTSNKEDNCKEALKRFSNYLRATKTITNGKHFNSELLIQALEMFSTQFSSVTDKESYMKKLALFNVIGEILFHLPANYAQIICTSSFFNSAILRNLNLDNHKTFYNRDLKGNHGLGLDYAVLGCTFRNNKRVGRVSKNIEHENIHLNVLLVNITPILQGKNIALTKMLERKPGPSKSP